MTSTTYISNKIKALNELLKPLTELFLGSSVLFPATNAIKFTHGDCTYYVAHPAFWRELDTRAEFNARPIDSGLPPIFGITIWNLDADREKYDRVTNALTAVLGGAL